MNFFKKLFGKKTVPAVKEVPNVKPVGSQEKKSPRSKPMEVQEKVTPSIEPIIMQAVKSLFPNTDVQEKAIKSIQKFQSERDSATPMTTLALLKYSKGDLELFQKSAWQSHPHFWMDEISPIFHTMEDAEKWVRSLSETQK